tara:strand:- start:893 stop:1258 length:366 start_codon:yes stop_codon:yes gene_type:complete
MNMSKQQQQLLMAWDKAYPVSDWELERNKRITKFIGHSNPFVTGERTWELGHKNSGGGAQSLIELKTLQFNRPIKGNKNSRVYHLPKGCPSFDLVSPPNIVEFTSEAAANDAGFRKAGNCQ